MGRINSGSLQERITLHTPGASVPDGVGGDTAGPETTESLWARVRPLGGKERLANGQTLNSEAYDITIRHRNAVSTRQRVTWKGKSLNVLAVVPDEDSEYLKLTCVYGGQ